MIRRLLILGIGAAGVLLPLLAAPTAAAADETGGALISLDGTTFSETAGGALFRDGLVLVPGSSVTGTFWVKNDSDRLADLHISVADASSSSTTLMDSLTMQAATSANPAGATVTLADAAACTTLLSGERLDAQTVTPVLVTLRMDQSVGNDDQGSTADARIVVSLADPSAPRRQPDCAEGGSIPITRPVPQPDRGTGSGSDTTLDPGNSVGGPGSVEGGPATDSPAPTETPVPAPASGTPPVPVAPTVPTGSPLPLPLLGTGGLALGAVAFLLAKRLRKPAVRRQAEEPASSDPLADLGFRTTQPTPHP
ncbi:hypothetical protein ACFFGH_31100 [Lysobacter korlensis]|uniref:LPXTG cell wall anchor domain-containing protein n=1 Tax=Lysobacter korlensis TaxID=553636 RepID=A0ABV6RZ89_9GAMM